MNPLVAGGGWKSQFSPLKRLFALLAILSTAITIVSAAFLFAPEALGDVRRWLCTLPMLPTPLFILLAIRYAMAEDADTQGKKAPSPHNIRNLY